MLCAQFSVKGLMECRYEWLDNRPFFPQWFLGLWIHVVKSHHYFVFWRTVGSSRATGMNWIITNLPSTRNHLCGLCPRTQSRRFAPRASFSDVSALPAGGGLDGLDPCPIWVRLPRIEVRVKARVVWLRFGIQRSPLTVTPSGHGKSVTVTRLSL